jgi:hypothetical protein
MTHRSLHLKLPRNLTLRDVILMSQENYGEIKGAKPIRMRLREMHN